VLLLAQTIAAAHFHRAAAHQELSSTGSNWVADSSCPICAAQLHSPAAYVIVAALDAPKLALESIVPAVPIEPLSAYIGHYFGRAPPASL